MVQRGRGKYRVQIRIAGKVRGHVWTRREDAIREERELMREKELMRAGLQVPAKQALLIDYAKTWFDRRKKRRPAATWTVEEARLRLYVLPEFGSRSIAHIQTGEWRDFLDRLMDPPVNLSGATRNRIRAMMHRMYREAIEDGICVQNPLSPIALLSEKKKTRPGQYWERPEEVESYLDAMRAEDAHHYLLAVVLLNTGLRIGEAIGLKNADVDLRTRLIHVRRIYDRASKESVERTKAGEGVDRYVPLNDALAAVLGARRLINPAGPVCARPDGSPVSPWSFRDAHERAMTKAGVKRITPHDLRRTYASHFIMNGGSKEALREVLGHSSQVVTEIYTNVAPDFIRDQAQRVEFGKVTRVSHAHGTRKRGKPVGI